MSSCFYWAADNTISQIAVIKIYYMMCLGKFKCPGQISVL